MSSPSSRLRIAAASTLSVAALGAVVAASPVAATSPLPTITPSPAEEPPVPISPGTPVAARCDLDGRTGGLATMFVDTSSLPKNVPAGAVLPPQTLPVVTSVNLGADQAALFSGPFLLGRPATLSGGRTDATLRFSGAGTSSTTRVTGTLGSTAFLAASTSGQFRLPGTLSVSGVTFDAAGTASWNVDGFSLALGIKDASGKALKWPGTWPAVVDPEIDGTYRFLTCEPLEPTAVATQLVTSPDATPSPTALPTPTVDPDPTPTPTFQPPSTNSTEPVPYAYDVAGSLTLKNLAKGTVPLTGTVNGGRRPLDGVYSGDLAVAPAKANLVALGFLPVAADVNVVALTPLTGTVPLGAGLPVTLKTNVRIKVPKVTVLGIALAGGAGCQTKNPSALSLTAPAFNLASGGTLSGTFAISDLTGCGFLTGIVSPLTAGSSNAVSLKLSHP
ncbi:MAG: hypothetical protein PGN13_02730 [Patulibacter minatonensis]